MTWPPLPGPAAVVRGQGINTSERDLVRLAERSFLSIWSYPNVWRDQKFSGGHGGDGKELCDMLVVFDEHVIIFSDKDVAYKPHTDPKVAWRRWYKSAVKKSADQVYGAERWLRDYPDQLFLDKSCTQPFPIPLPPLERMKVHRVVVAHGASEACLQHFGSGSGSLVLMPAVVGDDHLLPNNPRFRGYAAGGPHLPPPATPFVIGQIDPSRGYVHVLDDVTFKVLLENLDTITDFVAYLERKERFVTSGKLVSAAGEEDLLTYYLRDIGEDDQNDFVLPSNVGFLSVFEGLWKEFQQHPQRRAQLEANRVSYAWDELIERFNFHILNDSQYHKTGSGVAHVEPVVRFLARESRTRRRFLAESFLSLFDQLEHQPWENQPWKVRVIQPSKPGDPYYIFMVMRRLEGVGSEEYRESRRHCLGGYMSVLKVVFPEALDIIGIATGDSHNSASEDLQYLDARTWTEEDQREAEALQRETGILTDLKRSETIVKTYPDVLHRGEPTAIIFGKGGQRNKPCPCGSGRKYKHCHGSLYKPS